MKSVIAIGSGKGGVGKSTVAANLAVTLANGDFEGISPNGVALIDVDFYGPSIPTLMGGGEISANPEGKFLPALRYGVKYISIAFFLKNPDDPIVWRGPMFAKAINQLFEDVDWGEIDICIVDMPPGTGDAQLSLAQQIGLSGAVMVTTPQEVALSDVRRAVNMFGKVNVDVLGVVENMNGFLTPSGERFDIFGSGGGQALSEQYKLPFLGSLPIDISIREGGDKGVPSSSDQENPNAEAFKKIAENMLRELSQREKPELKVVN